MTVARCNGHSHLKSILLLSWFRCNRITSDAEVLIKNPFNYISNQDSFAIVPPRPSAEGILLREILFLYYIKNVS